MTTDSHTAPQLVRTEEAIRSINQAVAQYRQSLARQVDEAAIKLTTCYADIGFSIRQELERQVACHSEIGWPASFLDIAGLGRNEKRLNWVIGWWARPFEQHGLYREFLKALAERLQFHQLLDDLLNTPSCSPSKSELIEVYSEEPIPGITSPKQPDLLVRTPHAVLLLENKIEGGKESGRDQYGSYLALLKECAHNSSGAERATRAIFCSPTPDQSIPPNWDARILHHELGDIFEGLAALQNASIWSRISATLAAVAFKKLSSGATTLSKACILLRDTVSEKPTVSQVMEMQSLLTDIKKMELAPQPWKGGFR